MVGVVADEVVEDVDRVEVQVGIDVLDEVFDGAEDIGLVRYGRGVVRVGDGEAVGGVTV